MTERVEPIKRRRSLTHVGGEVETSGDPDEARLLAHALDVEQTSDADAPDRAHVHGFHVYPARAHPVTVRRLVEAFVRPGKTVLDPFCGSGTVLVEAMLAGRNAIGTDLNPIAVRLATCKTFPRTKAETEALIDAAQKVAAVAEDRRKKRAGASRRLARADLEIFQPHVVLELDGLRAGIEQADPRYRPDLFLILSSILVKVSTRRGDTSDHTTEKRIAAGYPSKLFLKKTDELAQRFEAFAEELPSPRPRARVSLDDAKALKTLRRTPVDAVITSPPYAATYDYLAHHEMRLRWLGIDAKRLAAAELGARRNYASLGPRESRAEWKRELGELFAAFARALPRGAPVVLLIADSATAAGRRGEPSEALRADDIVAEVAEASGLFAPIARASQARPHFHEATASAFRNRPRAEHALLLRREAATRTR